MIFSFILILSAMQTVLQLSKIIVQKDTFIGQLIHSVEVVQFQAVKKVSIWLKSVWSYTENLLKCIVLLFSITLKNCIELVLKWQWNGKECIITVTIIIDLSKYKLTMSIIMKQCI